MSAGTVVRQAVTMRLLHRPTSSVSRPSRRLPTPAVVVDIDRQTPRTRMGTCLAPGRERLTDAQISMLKALRLDVVRAVVELERPGWDQSLTDAVQTIDAVGARCQLEVIAPDDPQVLADFVEVLETDRFQGAEVLLFPAAGFATSDELVHSFTARLRRSHRCRIGGGSRAFFAELNRAPAQWSRLDLIGFPIAAQVHAFDDVSVMETLDAYADIVAAAMRLAGGRPLVVGPVTLVPRFNPYAPIREPLGPSMDESRVDVRQETAFAAAWTLGVLDRLTKSRPLTVLLHEATGPAGLLTDNAAAALRPVARLLHLLATTSGQSQLLTTTPSGMASIAMKDDDGRVHVLIANLWPDTRSVAIVAGADQIYRDVPGYEVTHVMLPALEPRGHGATS